CEWTLATHTLAQLRAAPGGCSALHPFLALSVCEDPAEQLRSSLACSRSYDSFVLPHTPRARAAPKRLRVAYVSADLREHAIAHLLIGVLERHDRERFEIHAVSLQPPAPPVGIGRRLQDALEHIHYFTRPAQAPVSAPP